MIKVFLVQHWIDGTFARVTGKRPQITTSLSKASRFTDEAAAEQCRLQMGVPLAWEVIEVQLDTATGLIVD